MTFSSSSSFSKVFDFKQLNDFSLFSLYVYLGYQYKICLGYYCYIGFLNISFFLSFFLSFPAHHKKVRVEKKKKKKKKKKKTKTTTIIIIYE